MDFAKKMRMMRVIRGLSQVELAKMTGIPAAIISRIETGLLLPGHEYEAQIREALGWSEETESAFEILAG